MADNAVSVALGSLTEPKAWPVCGTCDVPYVLRRFIIPGEWLWQPDCRHKSRDDLDAVRVETE